MFGLLIFVPVFKNYKVAILMKRACFIEKSLVASNTLENGSNAIFFIPNQILKLNCCLDEFS